MKEKEEEKNTEQQLNITRVILHNKIRFVALYLLHYSTHLHSQSNCSPSAIVIYDHLSRNIGGKKNDDVFRETRESVTSLLHVIIDKYVSLSFFFLPQFLLSSDVRMHVCVCVCVCVF